MLAARMAVLLLPLRCIRSKEMGAYEYNKEKEMEMLLMANALTRECSRRLVPAKLTPNDVGSLSPGLHFNLHVISPSM